MRSKRNSGFTLVELLVVIGIIALLISILLPALNAARRQAASVKCLAALRQVGMAFKLYEQDNRGYWPVATHRAGAMGAKFDRNWSDMIAPYISGKKDMAKAQDIEALREQSVVWGCPQWTRSSDAYGSSNAYENAVRTGYGMQYYPMGQGTNPLAYLPHATGQYVRASQWGIRGSERGLVADSMTHIIGAPGSFSKSSFLVQPFEKTGAVFQVDSTRHAKEGTTKKQTLGTKGINMLFCDGHAASVTTAEAWVAIRSPGVDITKP